MERALRRAAKAAGNIGPDGMLQILIASGSSHIPDHPDPNPHIEYLTTLARWTSRARETAAADAVSQLDHKGGRTPDENLTELIAALMVRYQHLAGLKPTHTEDADTGLGCSDFDLFVKAALVCYSPGDPPEPRKIDEIISKVLPGRESEFFEFVPPRLD